MEWNFLHGEGNSNVGGFMPGNSYQAWMGCPCMTTSWGTMSFHNLFPPQSLFICLQREIPYRYWGIYFSFLGLGLMLPFWFHPYPARWGNPILFAILQGHPWSLTPSLWPMERLECGGPVIHVCFARCSNQLFDHLIWSPLLRVIQLCEKGALCRIPG